jgi:hypothetical protein
MEKSREIKPIESQENKRTKSFFHLKRRPDKGGSP